MARHRRYFFEGVPIHVIFRGNERQAIFLRDEHRHLFLRRLKEGVGTYGIAVHAYVLMTNHVHLLVTPDSAVSLSGLFRSLGASYVYHFNKEANRTGKLWEDRHKTIYVADGQHLMNCMRYVELNPVRARMVTSPETHRWSSFAANALGRRDELITPHPTYLRLAADAGQRLHAYRALFDPEVDQAVAIRIRETLEKGWAYGDDEFQVRTGIALGLKHKLAEWQDGVLLKVDPTLRIAA